MGDIQKHMFKRIRTWRSICSISRHIIRGRCQDPDAWAEAGLDVYVWGCESLSNVEVIDALDLTKVAEGQKKWVKLRPYAGFPGGSDSKESPFNDGDPGSILGLGKALREGHGCPHRYSHLEKNTMGSQRIGHNWPTNIQTHTPDSVSLWADNTAETKRAGGELG